GFSYVPIDPCQGVVAALRTAIGDRIPREFIDLDEPRFHAVHGVFPDPYALKRVSVERFSATLLSAIPRPAAGFHADRIAWMASRLRELAKRRKLTLLVCSILDWPWIREAYHRQVEPPEPEPVYEPTSTFRVDPETLAFFLGELPCVTALYERGRRELTPDDNLSVDGVKELVLQAREALRADRPRIAQRITPSLLSTLFRYVRNLALIDRRLTPDLFTLVTAAKQTAGDDFALAVAETARSYAYAQEPEGEDEPGHLRMGLGRGDDDRIESFHRHVKEQARALLGADLARSEKFTTSVRDGLDIRETLRNWHTGDVYVKVLPPGRGSIEVVVFLFEVPADPKLFTNR
ncbi:hypothetical protein HK102_012533, partial [Quaeritorhiza haematococci]